MIMQNREYGCPGDECTEKSLSLERGRLRDENRTFPQASIFLSLTRCCCNLAYPPPFAPVQVSRVCFMSDGKPAPQNIQDAFLNTVRREKTTVTIYLVNGAKLTGRIRSFDKFSILLEAGAHEQLVFKHAISTISQSRRGSGDLRPQMVADVSAELSPESSPQLGNQPARHTADSPES
jgi:host factor-I protein